MMMFSGKKGFIVRCLIAVLFFVLSLIIMGLALPHFDPEVTKLEPSTNKNFVLGSLYFIVFPAVFFVSSGIVLGSKIKESFGKFFKFALTSVLIFLSVAVLLLDYKAKQINTSMMLDVLKRFDRPAREIIFPRIEALSDLSYITLHYFIALFIGLALLNFWHFISLARKISKDVGALYNATPNDLSN